MLGFYSLFSRDNTQGRTRRARRGGRGAAREPDTEMARGKKKRRGGKKRGAGGAAKEPDEREDGEEAGVPSSEEEEEEEELTTEEQLRREAELEATAVEDIRPGCLAACGA